jgi:hypothetical protein
LAYTAMETRTMVMTVMIKTAASPALIRIGQRIQKTGDLIKTIRRIGTADDDALGKNRWWLDTPVMTWPQLQLFPLKACM